MTRLDLKDAYFAIPIHKHHQKYLRFRWKNRRYQFQSLPFGLSTAPCTFTKVLRPVIGLLRELGIRCVIYLDDILIMNQDKEMARQQTWTAIDLLESLGFLVNYEKFVLDLVQEIVFLGFLSNSMAKEVRLPQQKLSQIQEEARQLLSQDQVSARALASFIGKLSAAILAIYPPPLHYRRLQQLKHKALRISGYDSLMTFSPSAQEDLERWINNLGNWNGRTIQQITPELEIETDASKMGWGAYCNGDFTGGRWSQEEKTLHINALELIAATFGVQAFCKDRKVTSVLLKSDNATVMAYVNRMGGTKSPLLTQLVKDLWHWCLQWHIHLRAQHLHGRLNFTADFLSRHLRDRSDWILDQVLFSMINSTLGPLEIRSICDQIFYSPSTFCQLASGSNGRGNGCFSPGLEHFHRVCTPPLVPNFTGPFQGSITSSNIGGSGSTLANSSLVPAIASNAHRLSHPASPTARSSGAVTQLRLPTDEQSASTNRLQGLRM